MRRLHLFEFNDINILPKKVRETQLFFLSETALLFNIYHNTFKKIKEIIFDKNIKKVQVVGAGDGKLIQELTKLFDKNDSIKFFLSDLHPDIESFQKLHTQHPSTIFFHKESINLLNFPRQMDGAQLTINLLHHFKEEQVKRIFQQTINYNQILMLVEPLDRSFTAFIKFIISAPFICIILSFKGLFNKKWNHFLWGLLIPTATFTYIFDGIVSHLRAYKKEELTQIIRQCKYWQNFDWEIMQLKGKWQVKTLLLIARPK